MCVVQKYAKLLGVSQAEVVQLRSELAALHTLCKDTASAAPSHVAPTPSSATIPAADAPTAAAAAETAVAASQGLDICTTAEPSSTAVAADDYMAVDTDMGVTPDNAAGGDQTNLSDHQRMYLQTLTAHRETLGTSSGADQDAAVLREVLLRFDQTSFELGLGRMQLDQELGKLKLQADQLADHVVRATDTAMDCSSSTPGWCMVSDSKEQQDRDTAAATSQSSHSATSEERHKILSQIIETTFHSLMAHPLTEMHHPLGVLETSRLPDQNQQSALLACLLRSNACRELHNGLSGARAHSLKALKGSACELSDTLAECVSQVTGQLSNTFCCVIPSVELLVYHALQVGCMVRAAHPRLGLVLTPACLDAGVWQPFSAAMHMSVYEVPGLPNPHPASRVVLYSLLPGVKFENEAACMIPERVVTMARKVCEGSICQ